jgi:hypothetical protein
MRCLPTDTKGVPREVVCSVYPDRDYPLRLVGCTLGNGPPTARHAMLTRSQFLVSALGTAVAIGANHHAWADSETYASLKSLFEEFMSELLNDSPKRS